MRLAVVRAVPPVRRFVVAVFAAVLVVWAAVAPARAEPTPQELERQIEAEWNKLEPIIEQYNMVHGQVQTNRAKSAALQVQLQPLQLQVDLAMAQIGDMAARMYRGGSVSALSAVLSSGSPTALADQLTLLELIAREQRAQVSGATKLRDRYAADKKTVDDLITTQVQQDVFLAAQKKDIEARIAALQRLRQQAYGTSAAPGALRTGPCPAEYLPGPGGKAAATACGLIGKPYEWGAAGPNSFDCSGLTLVAWAAAGVTLRHYTRWQWEDHPAVSRSQLRPGDLVFYYSDLHHMGIYAGGGMIVHAPTTGDYVRMRQLDNGMPIAGYRRPG